MTLRLATMIMLAGYLTACSDAPDHQPANSVSDSAGVTLVVNSRPAWGPDEGWRLDAQPVADIGAVEGEGVELFARISGMRRLESGLIVVAESSVPELRFFDESGNHVRSVGRRGQRPGEFNSIHWLATKGPDSLVVFDGQGAVFSVFDTAGKFGRSWRLQPHDSIGYPLGVGLFTDNSVLATIRHRNIAELSEGAFRDSLFYHRFDSDGQYLAPLAAGLGPESYLVPQERGYAMFMMPFAHSGLGIPLDSALLVADSNRPELTLYGIGGGTTVVRWPQELRPVPSGVWQAQIEPWLGRSDEFDEVLRRMPRREFMPLFDWAVKAEEGSIWLRRFAAPDDSVQSFLVFDDAGRWLGEVDGPVGLRPWQIADDYLLGEWRDQDEVPHVVMYRLIR